MERLSNDGVVEDPVSSMSQRKSSKSDKSDKKKWRDKFTFWVLGLNNQFGYSVVLTAAKDITYVSLPKVEYVEKQRYCCLLTTGLILLMLTVPAFLMQWLRIFKGKSFGPLITFSMVFSIVGYFMLAFTEEPFLSYPGIVFISIGHGTGEHQLSERSILYGRKIKKKFKSGTKDALIIASIYYTVMRFAGVSMFYIFITLPFLPALTMIFFWFLLRPPTMPIIFEREDSQISLTIFQSEPKLVAFEDRFRYIMHLLKLYFPLGFMIYFDGIINQGLYEFIYFHGNLIDHFFQYRIYICLYNLGYYACLVTNNLLLVHYVWTCTILHVMVIVFFMSDAIFFFVEHMWGILLLVYLQGINTGVAHTSINNRINLKEPLTYLSMAEITLKNLTLVMLILSGITCFGVHHLLSRFAEPQRP